MNTLKTKQEKSSSALMKTKNDITNVTNSDYYKSLKFSSLYQTARSYSKVSRSPNPDWEDLNDQVIKLKSDNTKLLDLVNSLKIRNSRLEEENKRQIKIIEETIGFTNTGINCENDSSANGEIYLVNQNAHSNGNFHRLKEALLLSNLKKEVSDLKKNLSTKSEELQKLKNSNKAMNVAHLECKYSHLVEKFKALKRENEVMNVSYEKAKEEKEYYKMKVEKRLCELMTNRTRNAKKFKVVARSHNFDSEKIINKELNKTEKNLLETTFIEKTPSDNPGSDKTIDNILNADKTNFASGENAHNARINKVNHTSTKDLGNSKLMKMIENITDPRESTVERFISTLKRIRNKKTDSTELNLESNNKPNLNFNTSDLNNVSASNFSANNSVLHNFNSKFTSHDFGTNLNTNYNSNNFTSNNTLNLNAERIPEKVKSTGYLIQVEVSEPQVVEVADHYFIKNTEAPRRKKSNSVTEGVLAFKSGLNCKKEQLNKQLSIDRIITEKIAKREDFDELLDDIFQGSQS